MSKSSQKAGDNSSQVLVDGDLIVNNNASVTLSDVNTLIDLHVKKLGAEYRLEATKIAEERVKKFEEGLFKKLDEKNLLDSVKNPGYQQNLFDSSRAIASSDDDTSETILTELLVQRAADKENQSLKIAVSKAIQIADKLDSESLCGLATEWACTFLTSKSKDFNVTWKLLTEWVTPFVRYGLPAGSYWQINLDELGLIKVEPGIIGRNRFEEQISSRFGIYLVSGVDDNHLSKVRAELEKLNPDILNLLAPHPLLADCHFIPLSSEAEYNQELEKLGIDPTSPVVYTLGQMNRFGVKDAIAVEKFKEKIYSNEILASYSEWWNKQKADNFTSSGKVIGYLHAKKILNLPSWSLATLFREPD